MKGNKILVLSAITIFGMQLLEVPQVQAQAVPTEQTQTAADFKYTETDAGIIIDGIKEGSKVPASLEIPAQINGKPVIRIGSETARKGAFQKLADVKSVKFAANPELKAIGFRAFYASENLESVDLTGLTGLEKLDVSAFEGTKLKEINFSANDRLKEIGFRTFYGVKTLKNVTFPQGKNQTPALETIGNFTFSKTDIETVDLSTLTNMKKVGDSVFEASPQLKTVIFPKGPQNNLETIGDLTFAGGNDKSVYNNLQKIDLSELPKLTNIGRDTFRNTAIKEVKLPKQYVAFGEDTFADRKEEPAGSQATAVFYVSPQNLAKYVDFVKGDGKEQFQKADKFIAQGDVEFYDKETMTEPVIQKQENTFAVSDSKLGKFKIDGIPSLTAKGGYDGVWIGKDGEKLRNQLESDTPYSERYTESYQWIDLSQVTKDDLIMPDLKAVYSGDTQPLDPDQITFSPNSRWKDIAVPIEEIQYYQNDQKTVPKNAGQYLVRVLLKTDGAPLTLEYQYEITPKEAMINGVTAVSRPENGSTEVELNGDAAEILGLTALDQGEVSFELGVGQLGDPKAGKNKPLTTDIRLVGEAAGNYRLTQPQLTVDITKKATTSSETKPSSSTGKSSNGKKNFPSSSGKKTAAASSSKAKNMPKTGATRSLVPVLAGLLVLALAAYLYLKRNKIKK